MKMTHREAMDALDKQYPGLVKPYTKIIHNGGINLPPKLIISSKIPRGSAYADTREDAIILSPANIDQGSAYALMGTIGHETGHILPEHSTQWLKKIQGDPRPICESIREREEEADRLAVHLVGKDAVRESHRWRQRLGMPQGLTFDQMRQLVNDSRNYRGTTRQREVNLNNVDLEDRTYFEHLVTERNAKTNKWDLG